MAYTLNCYVNNDENIVVNKTLGQSFDLTCQMKYGLNVRQPVVVLAPNMPLTQFSDYNYFYIPELSRYYYKTDIKGVSNNLIELSLDCDLLMSFKDEFLLSDCIVERNETKGNVYIADSMYPIESRTNVVTKKFPNALSNTASMVLITIG